jgi:hypothetical protein
MAKKTIIAVWVILVSVSLYAGGGKDSGKKAQTQEEKLPEVVKDLGVYDTSWGEEELCTLIIPASVVVATIDGSTVDWGLFQTEKIKLAIPPGSHTLMADYTHQVQLLAQNGSAGGYSSYDAYQAQQRQRQATQNMQSSNSTTRTAGQIQGGLELLGSLFEMGEKAAADKKAKQIQEENDRRIEEARRASSKGIQIYQRFSPGGIYELEVVPNSAGPYNVQVKR